MNTIILLHGEKALTPNEKKNFQKYDTICGNDSFPEEIKRWDSSKEDEAIRELAKYKCTYKQDISLFYAEEYGLEFCECDEDGAFIDGSDYTFAEDAAGYEYKNKKVKSRAGR